MSIKIKISVAIITIGILFATDLPSAADQPTSTITPSAPQIVLYNDADENVTLSTSQLPNPNCPGDTTKGPPDYYWDFDSLDGTNNGDGTATIATDVAGQGSITVYAKQLFVQQSDGTTYYEQTQTSTSGGEVIVQNPTSLFYIGASIVGGSTNPGYKLTIEVDDQNGEPIESQRTLNMAENIGYFVDTYSGPGISTYYQTTTGDTGNPTNPSNPGSDASGYLYDNYILTSNIAGYCQFYETEHPGKQITGVELDVVLHDYYVITGAVPSSILLSQDQTLEYGVTWSGAATVSSVTANSFSVYP